MKWYDWLTIMFIIFVLVLFCSFLGGCSILAGSHTSGAGTITTTPTITNPVSWQKAALTLGALPALFVIGTAGSIFLVMLERIKVGIALFCACTGGLILALAVAKFSVLFAIFGGLVVLAVVSFIGWTAYSHRKALKEVVTNVQGFKESFDPLDSPIDSIRAWLSNQSASTKQLVSEIKNGKGKSTKTSK